MLRCAIYTLLTLCLRSGCGCPAEVGVLGDKQFPFRRLVSGFSVVSCYAHYNIFETGSQQTHIGDL